MAIHQRVGDWLILLFSQLETGENIIIFARQLISNKYKLFCKCFCFYANVFFHVSHLLSCAFKMKIRETSKSLRHLVVEQFRCNLHKKMDHKIKCLLRGMRPFDTLCAMWYHLYELKNVQNTHRVLEIVIFDKVTY